MIHGAITALAKGVAWVVPFGDKGACAWEDLAVPVFGTGAVAVIHGGQSGEDVGQRGVGDIGVVIGHGTSVAGFHTGDGCEGDGEFVGAFGAKRCVAEIGGFLLSQGAGSGQDADTSDGFGGGEFDADETAGEGS